MGLPSSRRRPVAPRQRLTMAGLAAAAGVLASLFVPAAAAAHQLTGRFASPLPLAAYLAGAGTAVGVSFLLVFLRSRTTAATSASATAASPIGRAVEVPGAVRGILSAIGLIGWSWIVLQAVILGSTAESDVASLFLWVYGWVGLALVSAFVGPIWEWLDPFVTLHRIGASLLRRLGVAGVPVADYPAWLGRWPAVAGYAVFVWLELCVPAARGGRALGLVLVAYTTVTLVAMAQFGREPWRRNGEVFSVWFSALGRLAPLVHESPMLDRSGSADGTNLDRLRTRRFALGLLEASPGRPILVLAGFATAGILFDGLSQTQWFFDRFGVPALPVETLLLAGWLAFVAAVAVGVGRIVGVGAMIAGMIPIAVGYLIAHYLTYLLFDGQRIVLAVGDPLGNGASNFGLSTFEPATGWLPGGIVWAIQLMAVVGGHAIGAWAGHAVAVGNAEIRSGGSLSARELGAVRLRQVPLALVMVGLTTLTLWSLGQAIVQVAT